MSPGTLEVKERNMSEARETVVDDARERLTRVVEHWMEHNRGHVEEFSKWAEKARDSGHTGVSEHILEAAGQMDKANDFLRDALKKLEDA